MGNRPDFTRNKEQLGELEQAINGSRVRLRAIAIRLLHPGQAVEPVAQVVLVTSNTINA